MLTVIVNGKQVMEYRPQPRLPGHVRRLLDDMDADMEKGLEMGGLRVEHPDTLQCGRFVAMRLIQALASENRTLQAVTCAWLGSRLPALKVITAEERGSEVDMQLIME